MDTKGILQSNYLDLLFERRNKKYGSYMLRRKYSNRVAISAGGAFLLFSGCFLLTLLKPNPEISAKTPDIVYKLDKVILPPPKDIKPPTRPPAPQLQQSTVKPMKKFTDLLIKPDDKVADIDKPNPSLKTDVDAVIGPKTLAGSESPNGINPNLRSHSGNGNGPVSSLSGSHNLPVRFVDQNALPPGGLAAFQKYLAEHTNYPITARQASIFGRVTYQFIVDKDGNISHITILKDIGGGCGDAVRKVLQQYHKKWTPAKNNGHPVKAYYVGSFSFSLN